MHKLLLILACLIAHGWISAQQQLENAGFEIWEDAGTVREEPADWSSIKTSDNPTTNQAAPVVWEQSTDAHSRNYSVKLTNLVPFPGIVATGTLTNGQVHASFNPDSGYVFTRQDSAKWHTVFTSKPDSLAGWYKYYPVGSDHGGVRAILHKEQGALPEHGTHNNWIADANFIMPEATVETWTRFSVPFVYLSDDTPEYILVVVKAGNGTDAIANSQGLFDDLQLIYKDQGTDEKATREMTFNIMGQKVVFKGMTPDMVKIASFRVLDLSGRIMLEIQDLSSEIMLPTRLHPGIYIGCLHYDQGIMSKKFYLD